MLILGIDPSAAKPGYAVWSVVHGMIIHAASEPPPYRCDVAVVESGWAHGKMGKVAMWSLGFDAAWRLLDAPADRKFTIAPKAWRAALGGIPANAPKAVIVARLRELRYRPRHGALVDSWTDDVVEACGTAEATAMMLARKFKKDRKGLKEVVR